MIGILTITDLSTDINWGVNLFLSQQYYNANKIQGVQPVLRMTYGGRLSYGYDNLIFADFTAGYQGSEQFSKGNRYGFFLPVL